MTNQHRPIAMLRDSAVREEEKAGGGGGQSQGGRGGGPARDGPAESQGGLHGPLPWPPRQPRTGRTAHSSPRRGCATPQGFLNPTSRGTLAAALNNYTQWERECVVRQPLGYRKKHKLGED